MGSHQFGSVILDHYSSLSQLTFFDWVELRYHRLFLQIDLGLVVLNSESLLTAAGAEQVEAPFVFLLEFVFEVGKNAHCEEDEEGSVWSQNQHKQNPFVVFLQNDYGYSRLLTVFPDLEADLASAGRKVEDPWEASHHERDEREELELVCVTRLKRLDLESSDDEAAEHQQEKERLDHGALGCQEDRNEGNQYFPRVHHYFPVVRPGFESFVQEPVLLLGFLVLEGEAVSSEKPERKSRSAQSEDSQANQAKCEWVAKLVPLPAHLW